jgi:hypothetical protein
VRQTSLPQTVPPFDLPIARMVDGVLVMDETWYLFFYNLGKQVLPQENNTPAFQFLTIANLTSVLATAPDQVYPQPAPSPAGTLYWNGGVGKTGGVLARS